MKDLLGLKGELIFSEAIGESGGASAMVSSGTLSGLCFWIALAAGVGLAAKVVAGPELGTHVGLDVGEGLEARVGLGSGGEFRAVGVHWVGSGGSAEGVPHVIVPRLTEPDFTRK